MTVHNLRDGYTAHAPEIKTSEQWEGRNASADALLIKTQVLEQMQS